MTSPTPALDGPGIVYVTSKIIPSQRDILTEETFLKWYGEDHIPDILANTPINSALQFRNVDPKADRPYLLIYPMENLSATKGDGFKKIRFQSDMLPGEGIVYDYKDLELRNYGLVQKFDPTGPATQGKTKTLATGGFELGPLTTEQDFHDWYNKEHLERLSKVPGYLRTTRYKFLSIRTQAQNREMLGLPVKDSDKAAEPPSPPTWHAIHEFDENLDPKALMETIGTEWSQRIFADATKSEYQMYEFVKSYGDGKFFH